jgi:hypothetical protein
LRLREPHFGRLNVLGLRCPWTVHVSTHILRNNTLAHTSTAEEGEEACALVHAHIGPLKWRPSVSFILTRLSMPHINPSPEVLSPSSQTMEKKLGGWFRLGYNNHEAHTMAMVAAIEHVRPVEGHLQLDGHGALLGFRAPRRGSTSTRRRPTFTLTLGCPSHGRMCTYRTGGT